MRTPNSNGWFVPRSVASKVGRDGAAASSYDPQEKRNGKDGDLLLATRFSAQRDAMRRRDVFTAWFAAALGYDRLFWFVVSGDWSLLFCGLTLLVGGLLLWKTRWALTAVGLVFLGGSVGAAGALGHLLVGDLPLYNMLGSILYGTAAWFGFAGIRRWDAGATETGARPAWITSADVRQWTAPILALAIMGLLGGSIMAALGRHFAIAASSFAPTGWLMQWVKVWQLQIPEFILMIVGTIAVRRHKAWGHPLLIVLVGGYAVDAWFALSYGGAVGDQWKEWAAALIFTPAFVVLLPREGRELPKPGDAADTKPAILILAGRDNPRVQALLQRPEFPHKLRTLLLVAGAMCLMQLLIREPVFSILRWLALLPAIAGFVAWSTARKKPDGTPSWWLSGSTGEKKVWFALWAGSITVHGPLGVDRRSGRRDGQRPRRRPLHRVRDDRRPPVRRRPVGGAVQCRVTCSGR